MNRLAYTVLARVLTGNQAIVRKTIKDKMGK